MSLFGESAEDHRDFRMGLAGLLAGTQALRILAEKGLASGADMHTALAGVRQILDQVTTWKPGEREGLEDMFDKLVVAAATHHGEGK